MKIGILGSGRFMEIQAITIPAAIQTSEDDCYAEGFSLVYVAINQQLAGVIELRPTIRPEAQVIINELRRHDVALYIISGDHEKPTQKLAAELGIDHYFAQVLPQNKASLIEQLQKATSSVLWAMASMTPLPSKPPMYRFRYAVRQPSPPIRRRSY